MEPHCFSFCVNVQANGRKRTDRPAVNCLEHIHTTHAHIHTLPTGPRTESQRIAWNHIILLAVCRDTFTFWVLPKRSSPRPFGVSSAVWSSCGVSLHVGAGAPLLATPRCVTISGVCRPPGTSGAAPDPSDPPRCIASRAFLEGVGWSFDRVSQSLEFHVPRPGRAVWGLVVVRILRFRPGVRRRAHCLPSWGLVNRRPTVVHTR